MQTVQTLHVGVCPVCWSSCYHDSFGVLVRVGYDLWRLVLCSSIWRWSCIPTQSVRAYCSSTRSSPSSPSSPHSLTTPWRLSTSAPPPAGLRCACLRAECRVWVRSMFVLPRPRLLGSRDSWLWRANSQLRHDTSACCCGGCNAGAQSRCMPLRGRGWVLKKE